MPLKTCFSIEFPHSLVGHTVIQNNLSMKTTSFLRNHGQYLFFGHAVCRDAFYFPDIFLFICNARQPSALLCHVAMCLVLVKASCKADRAWVCFFSAWLSTTFKYLQHLYICYSFAILFLVTGCLYFPLQGIWCVNRMFSFSLQYS